MTATDLVHVPGLGETTVTPMTLGTRASRGRWIRTIAQADIDARAAGLRSRGMSYRKIADEMGCSVHAAHERVQRALAAVPAEAVEAIRAIEGERLTEAIAVALTELRRDHIMVSHGRIVRDEDGNALIDHGGKLAALHAYVKASESYRKLMGADLPVEQHARVTIEHTTTLDAEIEQLVAAMTPADDRTANA